MEKTIMNGFAPNGHLPDYLPFNPSASPLFLPRGDKRSDIITAGIVLHMRHFDSPGFIDPDLKRHSILLD
jgi:hypothetical protein